MGTGAKTLISVLVAGILVGLLAMLIADSPVSVGSQAESAVRDLIDAPAMSQSAANRHRDERFRNLTTIQGIMSLPSEFARAEATYALAGRSASPAIQALVFEADRIADDVERGALLEILFFRLAEVDPQSALALARTDRFRSVKALERTAWRAWARKDLDEALFAARAQTSLVDQKFAAQSLYAAFGSMGNTTTERIEAELGIEPDRSTRAGYLYRLADNSPAEAIVFINGVTDKTEKREYVSRLANYLSLSDPEHGLHFASMFSASSDATLFEQILKTNMAVEDPHATIERLLASGLNQRTIREFGSAVQALAKTDIEAALGYFQQTRSANSRRDIGTAIAAELARRDPDLALAWAQENELQLRPYLQVSVFHTIAPGDPQRAMDMALALPDSEAKAELIAEVIQSIAYESPTDAIAYLEKIDNAHHRMTASQEMLRMWTYRDSAAAMEWVLSQDEETKAELLRQSQYILVDNDLETAMRIAPRLQGDLGNQIKGYIASRLAFTAAPDEALRFIRQFEGEEDYDQLQYVLIEGLAQADVYAARQLADQIPSGDVRDQAYVEIIAGHARANPGEATRWLSRIDDPRRRGTASGHVAAAWSASDPEAANRWVSNLTPGPTRDHAIMQMASNWRRPNEQNWAMIESISDPAIRGRAKVRHAYSLIKGYPDRARELSEDEDITPQDRRGIEMMLGRSGRGY